LSEPPRFLNAGNRGAFTLDGTRTWLVGDEEGLLIVDPGPDVVDHVRAVVSAATPAATVRILLTHHHPDHAGGALAVAEALKAPVAGPKGGPVDEALDDGDEVCAGGVRLRAVHTPGHTPDHLCYHDEARKALFAGDHLLGEGDTTWVAGYPGCVADYLASLDRLRRLDLAVIHPAHGPDLQDPAAALDRFEAHRRTRIDQVRDALRQTPGASPEELLEAVYGDLPSSVRSAALQSLGALREYVERPAAS